MNEIIKNELLEETKKMLQEKGITINLKLSAVEKNNGVIKTAITAEENGMGCNFYIDEFVSDVLEGRKVLSESASIIAGVLEGAISNARMSDLASLTSTSLTHPNLDNVFVEVINKNLNHEMLKVTPHRIINDDLALIARMQITPEGSAVLHNSNLEHLGVTSSELIDIAISNSKKSGYTISSMADILSKTMGVSSSELDMMMPPEASMYVVANESGCFGAAGVFIDRDLRKELSEKLGEDYYIICSSIHEVICTKASQMDAESVAEMIVAVNNEELEPEAILSDRPYLVNSETLMITNPLAQTEAEVATEKRFAYAHM